MKKIHVVEITDPLTFATRKGAHRTLAQFEDDSEKAQKLIWWAVRQKYQVRYYTSAALIPITQEEKEMLDKILDEWNVNLMKGDSTDAI